MKPEHKKYILDHMDKLSVKRMSQALNIKAKTIWEFLEHHKKNDARPDPDVLPQNTEIPAKKKSSFPPFILIIILGFAVYGNSLSGTFIWDDNLLVKNNEDIRNWSNISKILTKDFGTDMGDKYAFYRPVQMASYMIDHSLWKLDPKGYHFTNIVLHVCVALSIYWLINMIFQESRLALLTGLFFVAHPIHTEAVTYIAGRADSLAVLFMLLCFIFYIKSSASKNIGVYILMLLSYTLALFSKGICLILPVLLLLYHYSFQKKVKVKAFLLMLSPALVYIFVRMTALKDLMPTVSSADATTLFQRLPGFFVAVTTYIRLLFVPFGLHMEYGSPLFDWANFKAILGVVVLLVLLIYVFRRKRDNALVFFSISWFLIALLPVSNLYRINAYMAEHWLYLPSIGFFLIMAKAISVGMTGRLPAGKAGSPLLKILTVIFAVSLLSFNSYLTVRQNVSWRDPVSFFERTLNYAPDSWRVHLNLGLAYAQTGRKEEAVTSFKTVLGIKDDYAEAYYNLGNVYVDMDKKEEAAASYEKAIELKADYPQAYNNLGIIYADLNRTEESIASYKKAIGIKTDYAEAHYNLGNLYKDMDKRSEAAASYEKAIEINPAFTKAYFRLGDVYTDMGKKEEAMAAYKKVVGFKDGSLNANAHNSLGVVYAAANRTKEAVASYKRAIAINSNDAKAYYNLGNIYNDTDKKEEALAAYKKVIKIEPDHAQAHNNLGNVYADMNKKEEAVASYKKAIELKADFVDAYNNLGNIYTSMDRKDEAEALLKKAIKLKPDYAVAYSNLAIIYFKKKQYPLAVEYFKKAEELGFVHSPLLEALKPYR